MPGDTMPPAAVTRREKIAAFNNSFEIDRSDSEVWLVSCKHPDCPASWDVEPVDASQADPALALDKGSFASLLQHQRAHTGGGSRMRRRT